MRPLVRSLMLAASLAPVLAGCDGGEEPPAPPSPQIVSVTGPADGAVTCDPRVGAGACPIAIRFVFRLPEGQFVSKAIVRFQGDGNDLGVDRAYPIEPAFGLGAADVSITVSANIPPPILRAGALFTYSVRLVTGAGGESPESTLTVSVQ